MQPSAANCISPPHRNLAVLQLQMFFPVQAKFEVKEVCFGCMRGALATSHMKACLPEYPCWSCINRAPGPCIRLLYLLSLREVIRLPSSGLDVTQ